MNHNIKLKPPAAPILSIPLDDYLSTLFDYCRDKDIYDKCTVSIPVAERVAKLDINERYCHVEYLRGGTEAIIWKIDDWKMCWTRRKKLADAKAALEEAKRREENRICAVLAGIRAHMISAFMSEKQMLSKAETIVKSGNVEQARIFGVEIGEHDINHQ